MGSVTDFSQQDVCHADLFISLIVSVDYQRNELNRLHRGVYEAAHTRVHTLLRNLARRKDEYKVAEYMQHRLTGSSEIASTQWLWFHDLVSKTGLVKAFKQWLLLFGSLPQSCDLQQHNDWL